MKIHDALKAIDPRVNFSEKGWRVLKVTFYDDYNEEHKIAVCLERPLFDILTNKPVNCYKAKAKQYGDMIILSIEKEYYNESYTIINNRVVDHETYNPSHFFEFKHYATLKQDYFRTI